VEHDAVYAPEHVLDTKVEFRVGFQPALKVSSQVWATKYLPRPSGQGSITPRMAFLRFVKAQFLLLDLFPDYIVSIKRLGWDKAWGPAVLCIAYCVWWFRPQPPPWYVTMAFICGLVLITGYYLWRADHVQLIPKLTIDKSNLQVTAANDGSKRLFAQLIVKSSSEQSVDDCAGFINEIFKWSHETGTWRSVMDQPLPLMWGNIDGLLCTLWPGMAQPLNIFFVANTGDRVGEMHPWNKSVPNWILAVLELKRPGDIFKFDILVGAKGGVSVRASLIVTIGTNWDALTVDLM
jgi:hypothetical protein